MITEYEDLCNISDLGNQNKGFSKDAKAILKNHPVTVFHNVDIPTYTEVLDNNAALESFNVDIQAACENFLENICNNIIKLINSIISRFKNFINITDDSSMSNIIDSKETVKNVVEEVKDQVKNDVEKVEKEDKEQLESFFNKNIFKHIKDKFPKVNKYTLNEAKTLLSIAINKDISFKGLPNDKLNLITNINMSKLINNFSSANTEISNKANFIVEVINEVKNSKMKDKEVKQFILNKINEFNKLSTETNDDLLKNNIQNLNDIKQQIKLTDIKIRDFKKSDYEKSINIGRNFDISRDTTSKVIDFVNKIKKNVNTIEKDMNKVSKKHKQYFGTFLTKLMSDVSLLNKYSISLIYLLSCVKIHITKMKYNPW